MIKIEVNDGMELCEESIISNDSIFSNDRLIELIIEKILKKYLSKKIKVWVFGSRATFKAKKYSDLDLALEAVNGDLVDNAIIRSLEDDFEERKNEIVDFC